MTIIIYFPFFSPSVEFFYSRTLPKENNMNAMLNIDEKCFFPSLFCIKFLSISIWSSLNSLNMYPKYCVFFEES